MAESLQVVFMCKLCMAPYEHTEENGPRILPCQSVVCEACLLVHQKQDDFRCPLCGETHSTLEVAHFPVALFPEDLSTAETTTATTTTTTGSSCSTEDAECPIHALEKNIFCKEDGCQRNVCSMCLMKDHSNHDVIAPENGYVYCSDPSIVDRIELDMVNVLCDQIVDLSISEKQVKPEVTPGNGSQVPEEEVQEGTGNETKPDETSSANDAEIVYDRVGDMGEGRNEARSSVKVHSSRITEYTSICYVSPVQSDDSFVVCGQRAGQWWLVRHRMRDGAKLDRVSLGTAPTHAQEVFFNSDLTIAVSYRDKMKIDFHEFEDLVTICRSYSLDTLQPGVLCTSSPSSLLCAVVEVKSTANKVLSIDCSSREPICGSKIRVWSFRSPNGICHVQHQGGTSLITADFLGLHAFDPEADQLLWTTGQLLPQFEEPMRLTSVTTDNRGRLFAADENNRCVQMFSAVNGHYLGYLDPHPLYVNCCYNTSTLILVHQTEENNRISFLKLSPSLLVEAAE